MSGARTGMPLLGGVMAGMCVALLMVSSGGGGGKSVSSDDCPPEQAVKIIDSSEHWKVHVDQIPPPPPGHDSTPKVVRARFAATELGTKDKLVVAVLAESALSVSLNTSLSRHVPRVHMFADATRVDADMARLSNLSPYRTTGGVPQHMAVLNAIANMSLVDNYDWLFLVKDSTYVNPFELKRLVGQMNWNSRVLFGEPDSRGRCRLDSAILISHPAAKAILQHRQSCASLNGGDDSAFESCLMAASNVSCTSIHDGQHFRHWKIDSGLAAHDSIKKWEHKDKFNRATTVSRLLSEADARSLHDHFVRVETARVEAEIAALEEELESSPEGVDRWPAAAPAPARPPNRYQVPTWEFFTQSDIFKVEPDQNVRPLQANDKDDVQEIVAAARRQVESSHSGSGLEFVQMRNGYRLFDPARGMDYMIDLVYRRADSQTHVERRVHLNRPIASTKLVETVPYVKEDTDVTMVIPVATESEVLPTRRQLARYARLCIAPAEEARKTRVVVAVGRDIESRSATFIANDLEELKKRCHRSGLDAAALTVNSPLPAGALDEAVDHYGPQTIFLLLSPHADLQREFLDRARINTIKKYQVFFPIPFVEFHPTISGMDQTEAEAAAALSEGEDASRDAQLARLRDSAAPKRKRPLIVQKDHGRFDSGDFSCMAVYGSDYVAVRGRAAGAGHLDMVGAFLAQQRVHILRAIEPTLRLRYHPTSCATDLEDEDFARCSMSKRQNVAAKDQLAKLLFHDDDQR